MMTGDGFDRVDHHADFVRNNQPQRVNPARMPTQSPSRRGKAAKEAQICAENFARLIELIYEKDEDGTLCNVDTVTWKVEIPMPWSHNRTKSDPNPNFRKVWGLKRKEADTHRAIMHNIYLQQQNNCLLTYNTKSYRWFLNVGRFPTYAHALQWLEGVNINTKLWKHAQAHWLNGTHFDTSANT